MAVGSPLSPVVDIYMEFYKELAMYIITYKPAFWLRYVDDMFVIWKYSIEECQLFFTSSENCEDIHYIQHGKRRRWCYPVPGCDS